MSYGRFGPYVSVAERRLKAQKKISQLQKKGKIVYPITIDGKLIAKTFWGKAWCQHLENFGDDDNRLIRGRTYVRNGSVIHLDYCLGKIEAMVAGSSMYNVCITINPLAVDKWHNICKNCTGSVGSLVELLQGNLSKSVMEQLCKVDNGLFPSSKDIEFDCSCYDYANCCKHVAAVLYGIGARLDSDPSLLFRLRQVNENDILSNLTKDINFEISQPSKDKVISENDLFDIFGLDMVANHDSPQPDVSPLKAKDKELHTTVIIVPKVKSKAAKPKALKPKIITIKEIKNKDAKPKALKTKVAGPKALKAKVAGPKALKSKTAKPKTTKAKVIKTNNLK